MSLQRRSGMSAWRPEARDRQPRPWSAEYRVYAQSLHMVKSVQVAIVHNPSARHFLGATRGRMRFNNTSARA